MNKNIIFKISLLFIVIIFSVGCPKKREQTTGTAQVQGRTYIKADFNWDATQGKAALLVFKNDKPNEVDTKFEFDFTVSDLRKIKVKVEKNIITVDREKNLVNHDPEMGLDEHKFKEKYIYESSKSVNDHDIKVIITEVQILRHITKRELKEEPFLEQLLRDENTVLESQYVEVDVTLSQKGTVLAKYHGRPDELKDLSLAEAKK